MVGTVIGGNWKGIDYMRSKANKRTFVPTQKQLEQQLKFALMMRFLQPMSALLKISFNDTLFKKQALTVHFRTTTKMQLQGISPTSQSTIQKRL